MEDKQIAQELYKILEERFSIYAKYTIQDRALPDIRDGLKPVQRRVLYAMYDLGLLFNVPYKKSARVVGEVIGKYHPHGDVPIYEAMVRMAQNWKLRIPLIQGHGNFGSIDGDSAAAMRYTEVRLSKLSQYLLQDLEKDTVDFTTNFDDSEKEPVVLPSYVPNLLLNGSTGIAAGYATNIPPHNLLELMEALIYRLKYPESTLKQILKIIKGPDFPTSGILYSIVQQKDGLLSAYKTGKGKIVIQAKLTLVDDKKNKKWVITELPYDILKSDIVEKIRDIMNEKKVIGIKNVLDLSDMSGVQVEIHLYDDGDAELIRKYLLKYTPLQINYNFNMVIIDDGKPICAPLLTLLDRYLNHQIITLLRKTSYDLKKAEIRLQIVQALIKINQNDILDKVIKIIRKSENKTTAKNNLMSTFKFNELQAEAIVNLRLYRLTSTDVNELFLENETLKQSIAKFKTIIAKEEKQKEVISEQLTTILKDLKTEFGDDLTRKTIIKQEFQELVIVSEETIQEVKINVSVSRDGYIKVMTEKALVMKEAISEGKKPLDINVACFVASTLNSIVVFTNKGKYYIIRLHQVKESRFKEVGYHINNFVAMESAERVLAVMLLENFEITNKYIILATKKGWIKRVLVSDLKATRISKGIKTTTLEPNDEVIGIQLSDGKKEVILTTKNGWVVRYKEDDISIIGLKAKGVKAIKLQSNDYLCSLNVIESSQQFYISFTNKGTKKIKVNDIIEFKRPAKGTRSFKITKTNIPEVITTFVVNNSDIINVVTQDDKTISFNTLKLKPQRCLDIVQLLEIENIHWIQNNAGYDLRNIKETNKQNNNEIQKIKPINSEITIKPNKIEKIKDFKDKTNKDDLSLSLDDILED